MEVDGGDSCACRMVGCQMVQRTISVGRWRWFRVCFRFPLSRFDLDAAIGPRLRAKPRVSWFVGNREVQRFGSGIRPQSTHGVLGFGFCRRRIDFNAHVAVPIAAFARGACHGFGNSSQKRLPFFASESTPQPPPIRSTAFRTIARPIPEPS